MKETKMKEITPLKIVSNKKNKQQELSQQEALETLLEEPFPMGEWEVV